MLVQCRSLKPLEINSFIPTLVDWYETHLNPTWSQLTQTEKIQVHTYPHRQRYWVSLDTRTHTHTHTHTYSHAHKHRHKTNSEIFGWIHCVLEFNNLSLLGFFVRLFVHCLICLCLLLFFVCFFSFSSKINYHYVTQSGTHIMYHARNSDVQVRNYDIHCVKTMVSAYTALTKHGCHAIKSHIIQEY